MRPDQLERRLQERLDALGAVRRSALVYVLTLPDSERAAQIAESSARGQGVAKRRWRREKPLR